MMSDKSEDQIEEDDRKRHEAFLKSYDNTQALTREKLLSSHDDLGLVLKCHLIAEDSLTNYLIDCKGLKNLRNARLTFTQKVELLDDTDGLVFKNKGGLKQLNKIRNRFGHDFHATLEVEGDSIIVQSAKQYLKGVETMSNKLVAKYKELGGTRESVEDLKIVIEGMRTQVPHEPKFVGDNIALLSQQEPRELIAYFVSSFCEMVAIQIHRTKYNLTTNA